jgi:hypothetical protein
LAAGTLVQWGDGSLTHYREPWFSLQHSAKLEPLGTDSADA